MNSPGVATITWARSAAEEALLRRSLQSLARLGWPVAVADAGTNPAFGEFLDSLPGFSVTRPSDRGLVPQVKASMALAATFGTPFILYSEPDKQRFFDAGLHDFVRRAGETGGDGEPGVALAARSAGSFATYPPMQRYAEGVINDLCAAFMGRHGDYSYGPFMMTRALLARVATLPSDLGWGWRHAVFQAAHRASLRVEHVIDDYRCPPDQRVEDDAERAHRLRQLSDNIRGLIAEP
jgi:hypothetical protein